MVIKFIKVTRNCHGTVINVWQSRGAVPGHGKGIVDPAPGEGETAGGTTGIDVLRRRHHDAVCV
jgi:hypothetical protein